MMGSPRGSGAREPERTGDGCDPKEPPAARPPLVAVRGAGDDTVVACRVDVVYGLFVWALLLTASVGYLVALKWHHHAKHRAQVADSLESLETLAAAQATSAARRISKVPILSTVYVFGAHYVAPYVYAALALARPYVAGALSYGLPVLRRLSPGWIFMQWGAWPRRFDDGVTRRGRRHALARDPAPPGRGRAPHDVRRGRRRARVRRRPPLRPPRPSVPAPGEGVMEGVWARGPDAGRDSAFRNGNIF